MDNMCMNGKAGEAPAEEEICFHVKAREMAKQLRCSYKNDRSKMPEMFTNKKMKKNKDRSYGPKDRLTMPTIWRENAGKVVRGSYCSVTGEWLWTDVATCECENCGGDQGAVKQMESDCDDQEPTGVYGLIEDWWYTDSAPKESDKESDSSE